MEIHSNLTILNPAAGRVIGKVLSQFKVGQIIPATVVRSLPESGQAQLNIGGNLVRAQSNRVLIPGQFLELKVVESGNRPQLKIVGPLQTETVIRKALLENIASQRSPALLPRQLLGVFKSASGIESLPEQIRTLAQRFMTHLPNLSDLSTFQGIRRAIGGSGIFLEARLAALKDPKNDALDQDLKAHLLRIAARAETESRPRERGAQKELPPRDLRSETDSNLSRTLAESARGALSKIVLDQISSLPQDPSSKQVWNLEIPFLNAGRAESARLAIERETRDESPQKAQPWSVVVELNPPHLGTIQCRIRLSGDQVSAFFRTELDRTRNLIQTHTGLLEKQLNDAGLSVRNIASGTGLARESTRAPRTESLFDERV